MKMGQKHLHELLGEDQEPFLLNSFVDDRSFRIVRRQPVESQLQLKKQRPASRNLIFSGNLSKVSCFTAFLDSPKPRRSPIRFELRSPKSPGSTSLHVPGETAALLLEAALRIQKNFAPTTPPRPSSGIPGFRLFRSLLKRLTHRSWTGKVKQRSSCEEPSCCACSGSDGDGERQCSSSGIEAEWGSGFQEYDGNVGFEPLARDSKEVCVCRDEKFCESPFRFVLQGSPHFSHHTPEITSSAKSSSIRHLSKDKGSSDPDSLKKLMGDHEEDEEEKEQCSPVCVLDPPFEDDNDDEDAHGHVDGGINSFDYERSFAVVQRAKQQLLRKLYRFEKLAELEPVELEKRLLEQDSEEDDGTNEMESAVFSLEEVLGKSTQEQEKIPDGATELVKCVLAEEDRKQYCSEDRESVTRGFCKRLLLWREADFNKIDMMVERDLRGDLDGWMNRDQEQVGEAAREIEIAIFGLMLGELAEELLSLP
ncbi:uncharacterized protein LOC116209205 [Punica granatum]|uniref:DUF4378 domain-containing protein n=2 Tax=Punica granatum TaxID=22663 RepID=A0A218XCS2_PUNGR|nr:uncharacterized protein LOC116209205 [Punica granatum]OWM82506.1 hypothetical protein CDL15_Pgr002081 [Punica granatum]PKI41516.1 hypothetical protein CRG98_038098 [Punica granatum]